MQSPTDSHAFACRTATHANCIHKGRSHSPRPGPNGKRPATEVRRIVTEFRTTGRGGVEPVFQVNGKG